MFDYQWILSDIPFHFHVMCLQQLNSCGTITCVGHTKRTILWNTLFKMDFVFLRATNFSKVCASIVIFIANTVMTRTWSEIVGKSFYLILSSYILVSIANLYLSSTVTIVVRHFSIYLRQRFLISSNRFVKIHEFWWFNDNTRGNYCK